MCNKVSYPTKKAASNDAILIRKSMGNRAPGRPLKRNMKPYLCPYCGVWHLTSNKRGKTKHGRKVPRTTQ